MLLNIQEWTGHSSRTETTLPGMSGEPGLTKPRFENRRVIDTVIEVQNRSPEKASGSLLRLILSPSCHVQSLSCVPLFVTPWTLARQAALSVGFSRQESCTGLPCPPPGDLLDPGIEPRSPALQADSFTV